MLLVYFIAITTPLAKGSRICQLITTTVFSELGTEDDAGYLGDSGITVGR